MVPLKVHFGAETFLDAVTIQPEQFYPKLAAATQLPTTSQPSPADFVDTYSRLLSDSDAEIISVHLSSAFSGTYQSAVLAKSMLEEKGERITVVDSKSASYGTGMLVVAAAQMAREGRSRQEIAERIVQMRKETKLYFLVDTLEYLHKGGRIGKASALFGTLLNIKPILSIDDEGVIFPVDKVRGHKKAVSRIVELLHKDFAGKKVQLCIAHSNALAAAEQLADTLRGNFDIGELNYALIGSVVGTHIGEGTVAAIMRAM
jgi:DegV family protein with EDD domain